MIRSGIFILCQIGGLVLCLALRGIERMLPVRWLRTLLWPIAALLAARELFWLKPGIEQFSGLPAGLRRHANSRKWARQIWQERMQVTLTKFMSLWPDRLAQECWQENGRVIGIEHLKQASLEGRPVILAGLHFGPLGVLRYCLRAQGWTIASLIRKPLATRAWFRNYLDRKCDKAGGCADLPHVFDLGQLKRVHQFLAPHRVLFMTVDGRQSQKVVVHSGTCRFHMATGALRLAAHADASVVPCLIRATGPMGFTIHFGKPVPQQWIRDPFEHAAACDHLLREFLPVIVSHIEQAWCQLLWCIQPLGPRSGATLVPGLRRTA